jgi:hypothetical protein
MSAGYVKRLSEKGFGFIREDGATGDAAIFSTLTMSSAIWSR